MIKNENIKSLHFNFNNKFKGSTVIPKLLFFSLISVDKDNTWIKNKSEQNWELNISYNVNLLYILEILKTALLEGDKIKKNVDVSFFSDDIGIIFILFFHLQILTNYVLPFKLDK